MWNKKSIKRGTHSVPVGTADNTVWAAKGVATSTVWTDNGLATATVWADQGVATAIGAAAQGVAMEPVVITPGADKPKRPSFTTVGPPIIPAERGKIAAWQTATRAKRAITMV